MADYFENDAGDLFVSSPSGEAVPIQLEDVKRIEAGGLEQFFGAAGRGIGTLASGAGALMGVEGADVRLQEFDRQAAIQSQLRPDLAMGEFLPDLAAGIATAGGSIPAQMLKGAAVEGALGYARTQTPQGALAQGAFGVAGVGAGAGLVAGGTRVAQMGRTMSNRFINSSNKVVAQGRAADGTLHAARASAEDVAGYEGDRILAGFSTGEQMQELAEDVGLGGGRAVTRSDAGALGARNTAQMEIADVGRSKDELFRSSVIADRVAGGGKETVSSIRDKQRTMIDRVVGRELGMNVDERLTPDNIIKLKEDNRAAFDQIAKEAGPLEMSEIDKTAINNAAADVGAQDEAAVTRRSDQLLKDINDEGHGVGASGTLSPEAAQGWRSRLNKEITAAHNAEAPMKADALQQMVDILDDVVERQIPEEVAESLYEARYRFRILLGLEASSATDAGGKVNIKSFLNRLEKGANKQGESFKRGTRSERAENAARARRGEALEETGGGAFMRNLQTLRYLTTKVEPDSGTAARLMANAGTTGLVGGAFAGGGLAFGD